MNTTIRTPGADDAGPLEQADKEAAAQAARATATIRSSRSSAR